MEVVSTMVPVRRIGMHSLPSSATFISAWHAFIRDIFISRRLQDRSSLDWQCYSVLRTSINQTWKLFSIESCQLSRLIYHHSSNATYASTVGYCLTLAVHDNNIVADFHRLVFFLQLITCLRLADRARHLSWGSALIVLHFVWIDQCFCVVFTRPERIQQGQDQLQSMLQKKVKTSLYFFFFLRVREIPSYCHKPIERPRCWSKLKGHAWRLTRDGSIQACLKTIFTWKQVARDHTIEAIGRFCKPNPVRFSERSASGFWPGRVKVHTNMCEPKVCSANRKLIFGFIFGSASSVAMRLGTFKKFLAETLLLSRHKSGLGRGRTSFLPWLALQSSAGRDW